jgi:hypothetical protein
MTIHPVRSFQLEGERPLRYRKEEWSNVLGAVFRWQCTSWILAEFRMDLPTDVPILQQGSMAIVPDRKPTSCCSPVPLSKNERGNLAFATEEQERVKNSFLYVGNFIFLNNFKDLNQTNRRKYKIGKHHRSRSAGIHYINQGTSD